MPEKKKQIQIAVSLFMQAQKAADFILLAYVTWSDGQLIPVPYIFYSSKSLCDLTEQNKVVY